MTHGELPNYAELDYWRKYLPFLPAVMPYEEPGVSQLYEAIKRFLGCVARKTRGRDSTAGEHGRRH